MPRTDHASDHPRDHAGPLRSMICVVAAAAMLVLSGLLACAREPKPEPEFETVEIAGRSTDNLTPDSDTAESVSTQGFANLPANFPTGLPTPSSSSVVRTSGRSVTFGTEDSAETVRADLSAQMARAGWDSSDGTTYRNGGKEVSVGVTEEAARTLIRYQY